MVQVLKTSNRIKWNIKECSPIYLSVHLLTYICIISLSSPWRDRILVKSKYTLLTILTDNTYRLVNFLGIFCCESREVFKMKKNVGKIFTICDSRSCVSRTNLKARSVSYNPGSWYHPKYIISKQGRGSAKYF